MYSPKLFNKRGMKRAKKEKKIPVQPSTQRHNKFSNGNICVACVYIRGKKEQFTSSATASVPLSMYIPIFTCIKE